jgi:cell division protein FtsW
VGSGQLTGVGLGGGQQKLFYLPAAHTDFIFAVIGEELGLLGCLLVVTLFLLFFWRGIRLARRFTEDTFAFSLAVGLTCLIVVPAFLNMGVVLGLLPTKGLVLPLVGYGGSSLIASLAAVGLLLSLARSSYKRAS